jgi:hypothetical protein
MRAFLPTVLLAVLPVAAASQGNPPTPKPERPNTSNVSGDKGDGGEQEINMPAEMRIRLAIERAEGEHRKILEDVKKLSDLSAEVSSSYQERARLSSDDIKKLTNIEKLAKRILAHAGGSEVNDKPHELDALPLADAISQLNKAASKIKNDMTAQTRHIVSASVIASSNEVMSLSQVIRHRQKKD